ncbi:MAG: glycosyltransferase family 2 protein [Deltaproteobacteria bacterium]|nr:glycosyltransferase family 2 protein [Deltaproteobacteria bacterium]
MEWTPGIAPVSVVMISLNEGHNMRNVLENLKGWAQEVFLVDSYSQDDTVDIALSYGVYVVQRRFTNFGDQWNFALQMLPIKAPWTMKLDPDERLSEELKSNIVDTLKRYDIAGISVRRRLWFMNRSLPVYQTLVRIWRTGRCHFSDVAVNEHPIVEGKVINVDGYLEHYDSPDIEHWIEKQNRYTTLEAIMAFKNEPLADTPKFFGTPLQRRMWLKKNFRKIPFRFFLLFLYNYLIQGAWRAGWVGYAWARLRADVMRFREYKLREIEITNCLPVPKYFGPGKPDTRVPQF